jgi:hypothetical protein
MESHTSFGPWSVDFATDLATCPGAVLRFEASAHGGVKIAFVGETCLTLEAQCLLAGEAVEAIERACRLHRV